MDYNGCQTKPNSSQAMTASQPALRRPTIRPGQQLSVGLIGVGGVGKTTFSKRLCRRIGARRVGGDPAKAKLFGSVDQADHDDDGKDRRHAEAFARVYAEAESILARGDHLVRDYVHISAAERRRAARLAGDYGAYHVIAWAQAPRQVSIARAVARSSLPNRPDIPTWNAAQVKRNHESITSRLELPGPEENMVLVDTTAPPRVQVDRFLAEIGWPGKG